MPEKLLSIIMTLFQVIQEVNMVVVSSTQAKAQFSKLIEKTREGDEVVIRRRGRPVAVMLSYEDYLNLQTLREKARREEALARLRALAREVRAQNEGLTPEDSQALADELASEAIESLAAKGQVRFERS